MSSNRFAHGLALAAALLGAGAALAQPAAEAQPTRAQVEQLQ